MGLYLCTSSVLETCPVSWDQQTLSAHGDTAEERCQDSAKVQEGVSLRLDLAMARVHPYAGHISAASVHAWGAHFLVQVRRFTRCATEAISTSVKQYYHIYVLSFLIGKFNIKALEWTLGTLRPGDAFGRNPSGGKA